MRRSIKLRPIFYGALMIFLTVGYSLRHPIYQYLYEEPTIESVQNKLESTSEERIKAHFSTVGVDYPPQQIALLAFKDERRLEVWTESSEGEPVFIHTYPILGASGGPGPKFKEGDKQVPEGIYDIPVLNPASLFHLSLRVDYPNEFDKAWAKEDGRTNLGGDIYLHGGSNSIGCIAIGDPAIEEIFALVARIGINNVRIIISPWDFRSANGLPLWTDNDNPRLIALYKKIDAELKPYRPKTK